MFMGGPTHEGVTSTSFTLPLRLVWSAYTGGPIDLSSPVVGDGRIYLGVKDRNNLDNNGLLCLDSETGERRWLFPTDSAVNHSPVLSGPFAIVVSMTGKVTAVNAETGQAAWTYTLGDGYSRWIYSAPAVKDGVLYAGSTAYLAALEAATGKELWIYKQGADWISSYSSPAVDDERVYIGANWNDSQRRSVNLLAIDKATGRRVWDAPLPGMHGSPTLCNSRLYAADINGNFYEFDSKTGEQLWKFPMDSGWAMSTPAISGDIVVAASGQGTIFGLNRAKRELVWKITCGDSWFRMSPYRPDFRPLVGSPLISQDQVFIGSGDGMLRALDLATGEERWSYRFGVPVLSTPVPAGRRLLVGTYDGHLYCFEPASVGP